MYVRNINERVSLNTLKRSLSTLFEPYGVVSITAHKNLRMRGQAFVALESPERAQDAVHAIDGTVLFQQRLECQLAKSSSDRSVESHLGDPEEFTKYVEQRKQKKQTVVKTVPRVNVDNTPPNKLLLIQGLPSGTTHEDLAVTFDKYKGFVEVRLVLVKRVAFVEFEKEVDAIVAKEENMGLEIHGEKVIVGYARK